MDYVPCDAGMAQRSRSSSITLSALADLAEGLVECSASADSGGAGLNQRSRRGTLLSGSRAGLPDDGSDGIGADFGCHGGVGSTKKRKKCHVDGVVGSGGCLDSNTRGGLLVSGHATATESRKVKQRLERNRDAAQAYRRRKKEQLLTLSARIVELEKENATLREELRVGAVVTASAAGAAAAGGGMETSSNEDPAAGPIVITRGSSPQDTSHSTIDCSSTCSNGGTGSNGSGMANKHRGNDDFKANVMDNRAMGAKLTKKLLSLPKVCRGHQAQFIIYFNAEMRILSAPPEYFELFGSRMLANRMHIAHGLSTAEKDKLFEACRLVQSEGLERTLALTRVHGENRIQVNLKIFPPVGIPGHQGMLLSASELALGFVVTT